MPGHTLGQSFSAPQSLADIARAPPTNSGASDASSVLARLKEQLKKRGATGVSGVSRNFRIMDHDHNGSADRTEFSNAMMRSGLHLNPDEIEHLFALFDSDGSGTISTDEFIHGLRGGDMSKRRLDMVHQAFHVMDKDNSGMIDARDIAGAYDVSRHPDVMKGKMTEAQAYGEFLHTFEVGGEVDGKVTLKEWETYYANLGASVDSDDHFELLIRNTFHISGGAGWCGNSSNKRVMVTHKDGRESVEEIQNDMGVGEDQYGSHLRAHGVTDMSKVASYGGVDTSGGGSFRPPRRQLSTPGNRRMRRSNTHTGW